MLSSANELKFPPFEKEDIIIKAPIATKSCKIKIPIEIFPGSESNFPLSDNNFIIIIVEEKDIAIAIYTDAIIEYPKRLETKNPKIKVKNICAHPIKIAAPPISFITFGFKCKPTMKRRNAIPKSEKVFITFVVTPLIKMNGEIIIPATMYPIIIGCLKSLTIYEHIKAVNKISASCINISSISSVLQIKKIIKR